jgi:hypothetical protein
MIENHRSGLVWKLFMKNPEVQNAMKKAGFQKVKPAKKEAGGKGRR